MLTLEIRSTEPPNTVQEIRAALEKEVYPIFRTWANQLLDARLAGPNKSDVYTVSVDNVAVPGREYIKYATKNVTVRFIQATVDFAVRILAEELKAAITAFAGTGVGPVESGKKPGKPWIRKDQIAQSVMLFYNGKRISASTEIKNFLPGDYIMVVPSHIEQAYANAKKYGAKGYMGKAARRIRTKLRITKGGAGSALSLGAFRSKAAWSAIVESGRHMTKPGVDRKTGKDRGFWGAWALVLRYRVNTIYRG